MAHTHNQLVKHNLLKAVPTCQLGDTASSVMSTVTAKDHTYESINYIYVLEGKRLVGVISIKELLQMDRSAVIREGMKETLITVHPRASVTTAAITAIKQAIKAVPVIDKEGHFLGVVSTTTILHTLHEKHVDRILRFAGIRPIAGSTFRSYADLPVRTLVKSRLPYLLIGVIGGTFSAQIVGSFEHALEQHIILAAFIPLVAYMADAIGTQTETVFVRDIAFDPGMSIRGFFMRELNVGLIIAIICGLLVSLYSVIRYHSPYLGVVLALSLFFATLFAIVIGTVVPWVLYKLKKDPAEGTGPLTTVLQDIASVAAYFTIATFALNFFMS